MAHAARWPRCAAAHVRRRRYRVGVAGLGARWQRPVRQPLPLVGQRLRAVALRTGWQRTPGRTGPRGGRRQRPEHAGRGGVARWQAALCSAPQRRQGQCRAGAVVDRATRLGHRQGRDGLASARCPGAPAVSRYLFQTAALAGRQAAGLRHPPAGPDRSAPAHARHRRGPLDCLPDRARPEPGAELAGSGAALCLHARRTCAAAEPQRPLRAHRAGS